jgi:hypothetical protein
MIVAIFLGVPWLLLGKENALEVGIILLWMFGVVAVLAIPVFLINAALDRQGKLLKVIEAVNFVCSLIGVMAGIYILFVGAQSLWNENYKVFLAAAGASAFAIYFYIQRYDRDHPTPPDGQ